MSNRLLPKYDDGWVCCSMHDDAGRRGIWYRRLPDGKVEIRAGREGDDVHWIGGDEGLADALDVGAWMVETHYTGHPYGD